LRPGDADASIPSAAWFAALAALASDDERARDHRASRQAAGAADHGKDCKKAPAR
jgi:hypothetical protein